MFAHRDTTGSEPSLDAPATTPCCVLTADKMAAPSPPKMALSHFQKPVNMVLLQAKETLPVELVRELEPKRLSWVIWRAQHNPKGVYQKDVTTEAEVHRR